MNTRSQSFYSLEHRCLVRVVHTATLRVMISVCRSIDEKSPFCKLVVIVATLHDFYINEGAYYSLSLVG